MEGNEKDNDGDLNDPRWDQIAPRESIVKRHKNDIPPTIYVSNSFDSNRIPITVRAPYKQWNKWEAQYPEKNKIPLETVIRFIWAGSKAKSKTSGWALRKWYRNQEITSDEFSTHFYENYILPARRVNPERPEYYAPPQSGGNPYSCTTEDMHRIRIMARHLYVFFEYWIKTFQKKEEHEFIQIIFDVLIKCVKNRLDKVHATAFEWIIKGEDFDDAYNDGAHTLNLSEEKFEEIMKLKRKSRPLFCSYAVIKAVYGISPSLETFRVNYLHGKRRDGRSEWMRIKPVILKAQACKGHLPLRYPLRWLACSRLRNYFQ